jgi:phosphoribosylamine---glycine ligase
MNVLIIGSGGREHALAIKIKESPQLRSLFILPGNPGTAKTGYNISIPPGDLEAIHKFIKEKEIELVIIGPEAPLVAGMGDFLRQKNIAVFGPDKKAADIEAHKTFSKWLMKKYSIPTAEFMEYDSSEYNKVKDDLTKFKYPLVIKADGLAAGKGVIICNNNSEAINAVEDIFKKGIFGKAGNKIIVEEFLTGEEASVFAITDGEKFVCLPAAQDHKRIGNNDTGKNTGGMGAYAPASIITPELSERINKEIISPVLKAMHQEGRKFNGCLYAGLMITGEGPKVIEFNCRFGDPETQVVLPLLKGDFLSLLYSAATHNLNEDLVSYNGGSSVCIIAASEGYPDIFDKGFEIEGLDKIFEDAIIYHAGTKEVDGKIVTNGGRVLGVTSVIAVNNIKKAKLKAYAAICKISFKNMYYRTDIADRAIR